MKKLYTAISLFSATFCIAESAAAYNYGTHSRIVEEAVMIMQKLPADTPPPAGVTVREWGTFLTLVAQAPQRLGVLKTGLPQQLPASEKAPITQVAPAGPPLFTAFPFQDAASSVNCKYSLRDNLRNIGDFRIEDFEYDPSRDASPCGVSLENDTSRVLQTVLGWHAGKVDDWFQDTVMWYRPTNAGLLGAVKHAASAALEAGFAALVIPFVCVFDFLTGGSCDPQKIHDLATEIDPISYADEWIPGTGNVFGGDYTGLWHFIDVAADTGQFNDTRGMLYEDAGRDHPGALDVGILALSDISGLSLHPQRAEGVANYGRFDRVHRTTLSWQATTIGHLEWSPIDHLAEYGWGTYRSDNFESARGFGWVLHAIGDSVEPHHVTGTTSWGHRPYEEYVNDHVERMLLFDDSGTGVSGSTDAQHRRIIQLALAYYQQLTSGGSSTPARDEIISAYIKNVAQGTYAAIKSADWPFNDSASVQYALGGLPASQGESQADEAENDYAGQDDNMRGLLEPGVAATLAFLAYAANFARDPGENPDTVCDTGSYFAPPNGCVQGSPVPPGPQLVIPVCVQNGTCGVDGGTTACASSADCAVGTCSGGVCSTACSASQPCAVGSCGTDGRCCLADNAKCAQDSDCCGVSCLSGVCQTEVVR